MRDTVALLMQSVPLERAAASPSVVGILGGMGPAATADFYAKLIAATPAGRDQDHLPVLIHAVPQIPDRVDAFMNGGPSPQATLVRFARKLQAGGVALIVMPCNTAHLWHETIARAVHVPVLHVVDSLLEALAERAASGARLRTIGLLATTATLRSKLYPDRAAAHQPALDWITPTDDDQERLVTPGIAAVKAGRFAEGRERLSEAARRLVAQGAQALVYACSEVPLVLPMEIAGAPAFDPTELLAHETVRQATAMRSMASARHFALSGGHVGGRHHEPSGQGHGPGVAADDPCI
jgi:aspartate racemase